jgi:hypothetical protein
MDTEKIKGKGHRNNNIKKLEGKATSATMTPTIPPGASNRNNSKQDKIRDGHDYRDYLQEKNRIFVTVCEAVARVA